ncbi:MAG: DNA primase, partial [SAR202 cluster bacterium]|nr:DNA primase [SAR202 cluster bacterium]
MSVADDVKSRLDVLDVVSGYVALQKSGRNYKAICPFHNEKTPSFVVNPERQSWRCFGACATGGDVISFVMQWEKLDFGEAIRMLADRAGIVLSNRGDSSKVDAVFRANQVAATFFQDVLDSDENRTATRYLIERGLDDDTIRGFKLGLSPRSTDGLQSYLETHNVNLDGAVDAGLLSRREDGGLRDFFRDRLMFPIADRQGRVVGFGARALGNSIPKYINTPRSSVFDKSSILYALHMAEASIKDGGTVVVVEGYMDVIAAHQYGFKNVVASMGTSLTERQVERLKSMATDFVLALDPDTAGQEATLRSLDASWGVFQRQRVGVAQRMGGQFYQMEGINLSIAPLPEGEDPDALIRRDKNEWEQLIAAAVPYKGYIIEAIASRYDLKTSEGKANAVNAVATLITGTGNPVEQEEHFRKLAKVLDVDTDVLKAAIGKPRVSNSPVRRTKAKSRDSTESILGGSEDFLEDYTLALLINRPELKDLGKKVKPEQFHKTDDRVVFTAWLGCTTIDQLREELD